MKKILAAFGLPTTNERGHELGCLCVDCRSDRDRADREPLKPGTLGALLGEALERRRQRVN